MMNQDFFNLFREILGAEYAGKPVWKQIADKELTAAPAFKGLHYNDSKSRLMIVGRAVNGWDFSIPHGETIEEVVTAVVNQRIPFADVVNKTGFGAAERKQAYIYERNSKFWRLIWYLLQQYDDANGGDWYNDADISHWNEKIVWSNLYKVAPYLTGNPDWKLIKPNIETYVNIIKAELDLYKPSRVLFVTGEDYFAPWKRRKSFCDILTSYASVKDDSCIVGSGSYHASKVLVCTRPDSWGMSYDKIQDMAQEIHAAFERMECLP